MLAIRRNALWEKAYHDLPLAPRTFSKKKNAERRMADSAAICGERSNVAPGSGHSVVEFGNAMGHPAGFFPVYEPTTLLPAGEISG